MDDVTDSVFRQMVAGLSPPDLYFTEFVNVDGLMSPGRSRLLPKLRFTDRERPLIAQLWGKQPANFRAVASDIASGRLAKEMGLNDGLNFAGVDLNMGCPQKNIVGSGTCSALINNRRLAGEIIEATKEGLAGRLPLSVKTRTGYLTPDMSWIEFLLGQKLDALAIHGRTKKEMSKVPADWQSINRARELRDKLAPETLIIGNGDVMSRSQGLELAWRYRLDGVMIGRGIFSDPYVFSDASPWANLSRDQKIELYRRHVELFKKTWSNQERSVHLLNKFCKIYISGFDGAKEMRERFMSAASVDDLIKMLKTPLKQPLASALRG